MLALSSSNRFRDIVFKMKPAFFGAVLFYISACCLPAVSLAEETAVKEKKVETQKEVCSEKGFEAIFDGKTLKNWDGNPKLWSVQDNAITGITTKEDPIKANSFIIWRGGKTGNFELKCEYRIINGNSGIQYRSFEIPKQKWVVGGYQADFEAGDKYSGILYGEKFRGILALRGEKTVIGKNHKPTVVGNVGDSKKIQANIKKEDWNEYHIIAKGNHFIHKINGMITIDVTDDDVEKRRASGILAFQVHRGPAMKVQFRNIRIKQETPKK